MELKVAVFVFVSFLLYLSKTGNADEASKQVVQQTPSAYVNYKSSPGCKRDVDRIMASVKTEDWAWKLLDAFGKPEDSILEGNVRWAGEYDQCRRIDVPPLQDGAVPGFKGRYCWLVWNTSLLGKPMLLQSGGCIPDSCNATDTMAAFPYILDTYEVDKKMVSDYITLEDVSCLPDDNPMSTSATFTLYVFVAFTILVTIISLYDYWELSQLEELEDDDDQDLLIVTNNADGSVGDVKKHPDPNYAWREIIMDPQRPLKAILLCFSAVRNAHILTDAETRNRKLAFTNGLRVLSFYFILVIHAENFQRSIDREILRHHELAKGFSFQFILTGHYAVETFFFISGFFFAYVFLKGGSSIQITCKNVFNLVFLRYLRTSVPMLAVMIYEAVVMNYNGDGPMWDMQEESTGKCSTMWWTFFFNIQNFFMDIRECCGWLWYVALDFQFYIVGVSLLFFFKRSMKLGITVCLVLIVVSSLATIAISLSNGLSTYQGYLIWKEMDMDVFEDQLATYFHDIYNKPYCRIGTYLVGLLYGVYVFRDTNKKNAEPQDNTAGFSWLISASCFLSTLFICYFFDLGDLGSALYHGLSRFVWCAGLIYLFQACINGYGGFVEQFLSNEWWTTMSRLTFSAYLVHMFWLKYLFFNERQFADYNPTNLAMLELGCFSIAYFLAFFFNLLFESPILRLIKLFTQPAGQQHQAKTKFIH